MLFQWIDNAASHVFVTFVTDGKICISRDGLDVTDKLIAFFTNSDSRRIGKQATSYNKIYVEWNIYRKSVFPL